VYIILSRDEVPNYVNVICCSVVLHIRCHIYVNVEQVVFMSAKSFLPTQVALAISYPLRAVSASASVVWAFEIRYYFQ